ncbi:MAG TPA: glycoside hydrolase family 9 protein [Gemmatimonadales bacterium]
MTLGKKTTVALVAALIGALAIASVGPGGARRIAKQVLGAWATRQRLAARDEEAAFAHLAASQVGYAPLMKKQFSSPAAFQSFRVTSERDGSVAFVGGAPARRIRTGLLGAMEEVWVGDFSSLASPGRYRIVADNGLSSHPFDVGTDVFDRAVRSVQRWFYYQRAFTAIDAAHAEGPWTHPSDADKAPPGVRMGWHDAGDFSIYSASLSAALFWLLEAFSDFAPLGDDTNIPESGNGVPDLLDEIRWGLEWMLSVQDASGGFRNSTCEGHYGPYGTNTPDRVPTYKNGEVGTLATARAVGHLAYASTIFRPYEARFADRCLQAAWSGYRYLRAHWSENTDGPTCPALRADGDAEIGRHARMYAAAGMLLATGDGRFRDDFEESFEELRYDPSYHHMNGFAAQLYLRAPAGDPARKQALWKRLRALAEQARADGDGHPFQWATRYHWGSIGAGFTRTGAYSVKTCLDDPVKAAADCDQALANVHYAFGRNFLQFCYVSGLPGVTRGRRWAFQHWLATLGADPHDFPGMVAGGPNAAPEPTDGSKPHGRPIPVWGYWGDPAFPRDASTPLDGRYTDNDSWSTNEVSVDWQASTLYSLYFAQWVAKGRPARGRF